jgi:Fe-S-cluster containining protein
MSEPYHNEQITKLEELTIFNNLVTKQIQSLEEFESLMQEWFDYCKFFRTLNIKPLSLMEYYEISV